MSSSFTAIAKAGSLWGAVLLISGSCVGAGMLALPIVTSPFGLLPSIAMFLLAWLLMTWSGQILAKVNLRLGYQKSLMSLAEEIFGSIGKWVTVVLFLFLFYCLSVAYFVALGPIGQALCKNLFHIEVSVSSIQLAIALVFGAIVYFGIRLVDHSNRWMMMAFTGVYLVLVFLGSTHVHPSYLTHSKWSACYQTLPILVISFGYQNMIPSLAAYFKGDEGRLRLAIWIGTAIPLLVYIVWQIIMLGMVPRGMLQEAHRLGVDASLVLQQIVAHPALYLIGQLFAFFAIVTSLLAQSLSLVEFLGDRFTILGQRIPRLARVVAVFLLPLIWAWWKPDALFKALDLGGGVGAVALFVLLPVAMAWKEKIPISRPLLSALFILGSIVIVQQAAIHIGWI